MAIKKQQKRSFEQSEGVPAQNGVAKKKQQQKQKKLKTEKPVQANGVQSKKPVKVETQKAVVEQSKKVKKEIPAGALEAKNAAKRLKNAEKLKKKNENRSEARKEKGQYKPEQIALTPDAIQLRIKDIESRPDITKTAKRRLAVLKKKLRIAEGTYVPQEKPVKDENAPSKAAKRHLRKKLRAEKSAAGKATDSTVSVKTVGKANKKGETVVAKTESKKQEKVVKVAGKNAQLTKAKEAKKLVLKKEEPEDSDEEEEDDDEEEEDSDEEADVSNGSLLNTTEEQDDDEDDEEEDEEEEEDVKVPAKKVKLEQEKKQPVKKEFKKDGEQNGDAGKKKRFVLFVGNLPYDATPEDIKKHFLTKVSSVSSVRVPSKPGTNQPRGFAYVEVENDTDYEKGLSLHNTNLNGRRLNVEYTRGGSKSVGNRQDVVSKNKKLHAMRKQGMLAGSQKDGHKRNDRRQKQRQQGPA